MSIALDLIGSFIVSAYVIFMGLRLNESISDHLQTSTTTLNVQEGLVDAVRTLESDFRKIGYGVADPKTAIKVTQPDRLRFLADMNRDGAMDQVDWGVRTVLNASGDTVRVLVRQVNNEAPLLIATDVQRFTLRYLKEGGAPADTSVKSEIWVVETSLKVTSPYKVADVVQGNERMVDVEGFWRQTRLASRNLKRHG